MYCSYPCSIVSLLVISSELPDGTVVSEHDNTAVPGTVLNEIWDWKKQRATMEDVVDRLRCRRVPSGFVFNTWKPGMLLVVFRFFNGD